MKTKKTFQVIKLTILSLMGLFLAFSCTDLTKRASLSEKPIDAVNSGFETLVTEINLITNHQISQDFHYGVDIIASVVSGLERSSSGEEEYIEAMTNAITNSNIKASLKNDLLDAVSIAYASSILWNTNSLTNPM